MEQLTELIGEWGAYQFFVFIFVLSTGVIAPFHHFMMTFLAPPTDHWCSKPSKLENISMDSWLNASAMSNGSNQCLIIDINDENITEQEFRLLNFSEMQHVKCSIHGYDKSFYKSTIINEWDLVCDYEFLLAVSTSLYFVGMMVGSLVIGQLSDAIGRKKSVVFSIVLWFVCGVGAAISTNFTQFVVLRFFVAVFNEGSFTAEWVLFMESCSSKQRAILGNLSSLGFAVGFALLAVIAYYVRSWQYLMIATTIPILFILIYSCFLYESPLWLISQGKIIEAKEVLVKMGKMNKRILDDCKLKELLADKQNELEESNRLNSKTIVDLFRTTDMRKKTTILYFVWLVDAFVYYGLSVNTTDLDGDMYINFSLSGIVEFPAYLLCILILIKFGRRNPLSGLLMLGGICLLSIIAVPSDMNWLIITLAMIGKFGIAAAFQITFVYTPELYPTVIRNIGLGSCSMFSRIGSIVTPFMKDLQKVTDKNISPILFGISSIAAGLLVLLLPDTSKAPLLQIITKDEATDERNGTVDFKPEKLDAGAESSKL